MLEQLRQFLSGQGVTVNQTTAYNPQGNRQCKKYIGIISKTVQSAASNRKYPMTDWKNRISRIECRISEHYSNPVVHRNECNTTGNVSTILTQNFTRNLTPLMAVAFWYSPSGTIVRLS